MLHCFTVFASFSSMYLQLSREKMYYFNLCSWTNTFFWRNFKATYLRNKNENPKYTIPKRFDKALPFFMGQISAPCFLQPKWWAKSKTMKRTWEKSINGLKKGKRLLVSFITNHSMISYTLKTRQSCIVGKSLNWSQKKWVSPQICH